MTRCGRLGRFLASGPAVEPADRGAGQGEGAAAVCEAVRGLWADVGGGVEGQRRLWADPKPVTPWAWRTARKRYS